jgi:GMP synthase-like glutamine amidotransferase
MIAFIDLEHASWVQLRLHRQEHYAYIMDVKLKLETLAGQPCLVQRYCDTSLEALRALDIRALAISGNATDFTQYGAEPFAEMYRIIRAAEWPIIGFCGGHHLIAQAHGAEVAPMRRLRPGEADLTALSAPGYLKEWGFAPVPVAGADPLLTGLGAAPVFLEMHYWEVKQMPADFDLLASTPACQVQLMRRKDRPVYGAQFHPECYTEWPQDQRNEKVNIVYPEGYPGAAPDGRQLLANFFRLAGLPG